MKSQNGWPASQNARDLGVVPLVVNGTEFVGGVRGGDVHTVLEHFWTQFDKRVERLKNPGCWGWSFRPNRNDPNSLSNHSSATAADGDAPAHPNGIEASHNFSAKQIAEIHQILAEIPELADVLHWGGDWHRSNGLTPDPMHAEIHGHDTAKLARVAKRCKAFQKEKAMNAVEKYRAAVVQADRDFGCHIDPDRKAAQDMRSAIKAALEKGPSK